MSPDHMMSCNVTYHGEPSILATGGTPFYDHKVAVQWYSIRDCYVINEILFQESLSCTSHMVFAGRINNSNKGCAHPTPSFFRSRSVMSVETDLQPRTHFPPSTRAVWIPNPRSWDGPFSSGDWGSLGRYLCDIAAGSYRSTLLSTIASHTIWKKKS